MVFSLAMAPLLACEVFLAAADGVAEGGEAEGPGCGLSLELESVLSRPVATGLVSALGGVDEPPSSWCLRITHEACTIMGKVSVSEATVTVIGAGKTGLGERELVEYARSYTHDDGMW